MKPVRVDVEWVDSAVFPTWRPLEDVETMQPERCLTSGFRVRDDGVWLHVAGSVSLDPDGYVSSVSDVIAIPWCAIVSTSTPGATLGP